MVVRSLLKESAFYNRNLRQPQSSSNLSRPPRSANLTASGSGPSSGAARRPRPSPIGRKTPFTKNDAIPKSNAAEVVLSYRRPLFKNNRKTDLRQKIWSGGGPDGWEGDAHNWPSGATQVELVEEKEKLHKPRKYNI